MSAENGIAKLLLDNTAVSALVGTRVGHVLSAQDAALPRLVVQRGGTRHIENLQNSSGLALAGVEVNCFAATKALLDDLSDKVRLAVQGFRGTVGGIAINVEGVEDERDLSESPEDGSDRPLLWWMIIFKERRFPLTD